MKNNELTEILLALYQEKDKPVLRRKTTAETEAYLDGKNDMAAAMFTVLSKFNKQNN